MINLAVDKFNSQYGLNIDPDECTIVSIRSNYGCTYAYEIDTNRTDDALRLRMYFNLLNQDGLGDYRLEVDETFLKDQLGDEVYVAIGTVNSYYLDSGIYRFRTIGGAVYSELVMLDTDGAIMEFAEGGNFEFVESTV